MSNEKFMEKNLKYTNISFGVVIIILSILVLVFSEESIVILMIILSLTLLVSGLARIMNAISDKQMTNVGIILKFITGFSAIILSIIIIISIIIDPVGSIIIATTLFGIILMIIGLIRLYMGVTIKKYDKYYQGFILIVGFLTFLFGILVIALPGLGFFILIVLISITLMLNGVIRLISGIFF